jgi:hypothetical protein
MENESGTIEWKMIRPDKSERVLHIGKNEVKSEELNYPSTNSLILFEIYFSPIFKTYLRFYGYSPIRLIFERVDGPQKHIYIDNNQSFVYLDQLEYTTIQVYDQTEFVTFSFKKTIKKPKIDYDLIEKKKRIQWLNDNIEYEDLKREENEYGTKSLYSQNFFNYNKKNLKSKNEREKNDSMSELSREKSDSLSSIKGKREKNEEESEESQKSLNNKMEEKSDNS